MFKTILACVTLFFFPHESARNERKLQAQTIKKKNGTSFWFVQMRVAQVYVKVGLKRKGLSRRLRELICKRFYFQS